MTAAQGKVIIPCAVTGSIHTPSMSPHLPITPAEVARAAIGAAQAGAEGRRVEIPVLEGGLGLPVRADEQEQRRLAPRVR